MFTFPLGAYLEEAEGEVHSDVGLTGVIEGATTFKRDIKWLVP